MALGLRTNAIISNGTGGSCGLKDMHARCVPKLQKTEFKTYDEFSGIVCLAKDCIWNDGTNVYYSNREQQYILNRATNTWEPKVWYGLPSINIFIGTQIWKDADGDIYLTVRNSDASIIAITYLLNKATSTWSEIAFGSPVSIMTTPKNIWNDGTHTYYSQTTTQRVLNKSTTPYVWEAKSWSGSGLPSSSFTASTQLWSDGTDIYYINNGNYYVLNKANSTWTQKTFYGLPSGYTIQNANYIFPFGTKMCMKVTDGGSTYIYYYDKSTSTWINTNKTTANSYWPTNRSQVWVDGNISYWSNLTEIQNIQKVCNESDYSWVDISWKVDGSIFGGLNRAIWTDGKELYLSYQSYPYKHYVLDAKTREWKPKKWKGLTEFYGENIWTDGENIYYSVNTSHYVLVDGTWVTKNWNVPQTMMSDGEVYFSGRNIFSDGDNIYYNKFASNTRYWCILDKTTSTWTDATITMPTTSNSTAVFYYQIWTDGDNVYYSHGDTHYVLNKSNNTWSTKTWSGLTSFYAYSIFCDGSNIYCIAGSQTSIAVWKLNKSNSTWSQITTSGLPYYILPIQVWTDGGNIYFTGSNRETYAYKTFMLNQVSVSGSIDEI